METTNNTELENQLQRRCEISDARLGVAENMGWATALFALLAAYLYWGSWVVAFASGVAVYCTAVYQYGKQRKHAWDEYERATKTGKYYQG